MEVSRYKVEKKNFEKRIKLALVSDLHASDPRDAIKALKEEEPNYILMPGDILEPLDGRCDEKNSKGFSVFSECARIAPTFYSIGNHEDGGIHSESPKWRKIRPVERKYTDENMQKILSSGVIFLDDRYEIVDGIAFGGLSSGFICEDTKPNLSFLSEFSALPMPKILLCHHPEYYEKYIRHLDIDLIVSGHAHGGQWRFFGRGVYAPGQGLFPKYTSGVYEERLVVSRGLKPGGKIPRIFNPTEVVIIEI